MPEIGIAGLVVILIVALLVFGPKRLPEIGHSLGKGMREFKDSITGNDKPAEKSELLRWPRISHLKITPGAAGQLEAKAYLLLDSEPDGTPASG